MACDENQEAIGEVNERTKRKEINSLDAQIDKPLVPSHLDLNEAENSKPEETVERQTYRQTKSDPSMADNYEWVI